MTNAREESERERESFGSERREIEDEKEREGERVQDFENENCERERGIKSI